MPETILVCGGSGGVGRLLCERLGRAGHQAIATYHQQRDQTLAWAEAAAIPAIPLDLSRPDGVGLGVEELAALGLEPTGVVFAASPRPEIAPFGKISDAEMERQWQVNVRGPHRLLAELIKRYFRKSRRGTAIAVLSAAMGDPDGRGAVGSMAGYVEAKFGLRGVLTAARAEFDWLRIGFVAPDFIETPMLDVFDPRYLDMMRARQTLGRFLSPDEVAGDIERLITDAP
jgi:NAD(P)-dependent dehydrogenase (short-subunit alcohol dehydrogenase family)